MEKRRSAWVPFSIPRPICVAAGSLSSPRIAATVVGFLANVLAAPDHPFSPAIRSLPLSLPDAQESRQAPAKKHSDLSHKNGARIDFHQGGSEGIQRATRLVTTNRGIWRAIVPTSAIVS